MWPLIADLYTPLLAIGVGWMLFRKHKIRAGLVFLPLSLLMVFAFSFLESQLGLWRSWGLDFSTHTAILLPFYQMLLVLMLLPADPHGLKNPGWILRLKQGAALITALVTGAGYGLLMMQLNYHTLADILTTVVSIYPLVWICFHLLKPMAFAAPSAERAA